MANWRGDYYSVIPLDRYSEFSDYFRDVTDKYFKSSGVEQNVALVMSRPDAAVWEAVASLEGAPIIAMSTFAAEQQGAVLAMDEAQALSTFQSHRDTLIRYAGLDPAEQQAFNSGIIAGSIEYLSNSLLQLIMRLIHTLKQITIL